MSLFGALFSGVSGLSANSQAMGIIADNITNVNTIGYKRAVAGFSTIVAESVSRTEFSPGGVRSLPSLLIDAQGVLQTSESPLDLAITGKGFFPVNTNNDLSGFSQFTRAGSFRPDENGFLVNAAGLFLLGWAAASDGVITDGDRNFANLVPIQVTDLGTKVPTTTAVLKANFNAAQGLNPAEAAYSATVNNMASGTIVADFERSIQVIDSQGKSRTLTMAFLKSSVANEWHAELFVRPAADVDLSGGLVDGQVATGIIAFNTDGSLNVPATTLASNITINWADTITAVLPTQLALNFGTNGQTDGFTQFAAASDLISSNVNGAQFARLTSISINETGDLNGLFANGVVKRLFQIPIATFQNPNGLANKTGNAFERTDASGAFTLKTAGSGAGRIAPGALEASTVDIGEEFTAMITVQRAFSAASRVITTADDMLDELIRIKR